MRTVVALVLPTGFTEQYEEAVQTLPGVTLRWVLYDRDDDVRTRVRQLLETQHVDAMFMGPVPYDLCHDVLPAELHVGLLRVAPIELAIAFSRASAAGWTPTPVSIDTFDAPVVAEVGKALDLPLDKIACLPFAPGQTADDVIAFHRRNLAEAGGGYVITARTEVTLRLSDEVPLLKAFAVPSSIQGGLHELLLRVSSKRNSELRFGAGVFTVMPDVNARDVDRARVAVMHTLLNLPEFADAWIEDRGKRGVLVFAHKALLQKATEDWTSVPALRAAEQHLGFRLAAGFGLGESARRSVQLAERAAVRAEQDGGGCAYLIDGGLIIGPMEGAAKRLTFTYREHEDKLEDLARSVGLSPVTLSRLTAIDRTLGARPVSPAELADALGITDPSGRRLLRTLTAHGLAAVAGSTQTARKGRPARLYRLQLDHHLAPIPEEGQR